MSQKSAILNFPESLMDRPVISWVIRNYNVEVNIIQAHITPEEDGYMFAIFSGKRQAIEQAFDYLRESSIKVVLPARNVVWNESRCVHCTACVGQCSSLAFTINQKSKMVEHIVDRCIACKLCIPACCYGALEAVGDEKRKTGKLDVQNI